MSLMDFVLLFSLADKLINERLKRFCWHGLYHHEPTLDSVAACREAWTFSQDHLSRFFFCVKFLQLWKSEQEVGIADLFSHSETTPVLGETFYFPGKQ